MMRWPRKLRYRIGGNRFIFEEGVEAEILYNGLQYLRELELEIHAFQCGHEPKAISRIGSVAMIIKLIG
ncbi:hypothetical protein T235_06505 [Tannerella sp. oral taxon BU063 isolate Cell 8/11]|jgi:hypothetical protein|uniref:Uncharacterized protein n=1 Tax=Tannerella sp. oral taxon BU063 isolate Cell 8/11 TaxID=1411915 RepID=W2D2A2_9BACT|nr:hypothetical protein T235_06505 [Tannerella sp. oral taxon BU063 isolate Cell 8/11]